MKFTYTVLSLSVLSAVEAATNAPDLIEVTNFRPGSTPLTTVVDFVLDEESDLLQCCNYFNLVPADGTNPVESEAVLSPNLPSTTFSAVFPGNLVPGDFARGTIFAAALSSTDDGTINPPQAAMVTGGSGGTIHPDLVSVVKDGDQLIFEFDEAVDRANDVIENVQSLQFFTKEAEIYNSVAVQPGYNSYSVRALYSLPKDVSLDDAVGAFVPEGNIKGDPDGNDQNDLDVVNTIGDTGLVVCEPSSKVGGTGDNSGPTEAPDLQSVGNFRRGPFTPKYETTTCVDFTFDQVAYISGGKPSNFLLVKSDGTRGVPGTTKIATPEESDIDGDNIITVVFLGDLDEASFSRGYVESKVVNSDPSTVNSDYPYNDAQSATVAGQSPTTAVPDLVGVDRDGDTFIFEFDMDLDYENGVTQNQGGLRIYFPSTDAGQTIPYAASVEEYALTPRTIRAFYTQLPEGYQARDAVGAYVLSEIVDAKVSNLPNQGRNGFQETANIGVILDQFCAPSSSVGGTGDGSGPTEAPDLMAVGNFRRGPFTTEFDPTTCVDFTFDQVAYINGGKRSNFLLVPLDASNPLEGNEAITPDTDQVGDNIITIAYPGILDPADFARGYVETGIVNDNCCQANSDYPFNINQAEPISPNTQSANPDLVSVTIGSTSLQLYYTFDQPLSQENVDNSNDKLCVYFNETATTKTIPFTCADNAAFVDQYTIRGIFDLAGLPQGLPAGYGLLDAVGAFVQSQGAEALEGTGGAREGFNAFDEKFITF